MYFNLSHVGVGAGNDLLEFSDMLDFKGTGTLGNHILNFLEHFVQFFFLMWVSTMKIISKLYYILTKNKMSVKLCFTCLLWTSY